MGAIIRAAFLIDGRILLLCLLLLSLCLVSSVLPDFHATHHGARCSTSSLPVVGVLKLDQIKSAARQLISRKTG